MQDYEKKLIITGLCALILIGFISPASFLIGGIISTPLLTYNFINKYL